MNTLQAQWQRFEHWLLSEAPVEHAWFYRLSKQSARILYAVVRDVLKGQLTLHAMSLVYTTMLSVVPLLALSLSILKAFNVQDKFTPMLWTFFEPMGEKGLELHNAVLSFIDNIKFGVLGAVGFVLLFYTVISLVQKIETSFNTIWHAPELRSLSQRFSNYLSVILVGPVLVVAALSVTATTMNSGIVRTVMEIEPFGTLILGLTKLMPFFMIIGAFTFFYVLMPNTRVHFRSALVGGVLAGCMWQATSLAFTSFVVGSAKYDAIYSGFAVGIVLLIWIYVNWLILLIGSSIAFYHQHGSHITLAENLELAPELLRAAGLDVLCRVARRHQLDQQPIRQAELEAQMRLPAVLTRRLVDRLVTHGLLLWVGDKSDQLALAASSDQMPLARIFVALDRDDCHLRPGLGLDAPVQDVLQRVDRARAEVLGPSTLRDLIDG
jgi:membrane protein